MFHLASVTFHVVEPGGALIEVLFRQDISFWTWMGQQIWLLEKTVQCPSCFLLGTMNLMMGITLLSPEMLTVPWIDILVRMMSEPIEFTPNFSGLYRFLFVRKLVNGLGSILHYSRSISKSLLLKLTNSHYWSTWECAHHNINRKSTMHSASFDIRSLNWITMRKHWLGSHKPIRVSRDATAEDCFGTVQCNPSSREMAWPGLQTAHYVLITIPWNMETFGVFCLWGMAITDHKHSKVLWANLAVVWSWYL